MNQTLKRSVKIFISLTVFVYLGFSCAKQVGLTGGPADKDPPNVVLFEPENASVNFKQNIIRIYFDEYIRLNNLNQKLIISPPIETAPSITLRGKSIQIKLNLEQLEENTTYCLNFNDAVADNNENNVLHSLIYAFSTGPIIDSLQVTGIVLDAYTKKPIKDTWVLLHNNISDTAFKTIKPVYLAKVNDKGEFTIPFLKEGKYNIFALTDANYNYKFDLTEEPIAFLDSIIIPGVKILEPSSDSVVDEYKCSFKYFPDNVQLLLFTEDFERQYIKTRTRKSKKQIDLIFNRIQYNDFKFNVKNDSLAIVFHSEFPDTISLWLTNPDLIASDTIYIFAEYYSHFTPDSIIFDTLRITQTIKDFTADSVLNISAPKQKMPGQDYYIHFNQPVRYFSADNIQLLLKQKEDTIKHDFRLIPDREHPLKLKLEADFVEKENYLLVFENNFATSIYDLSNNSDTIAFNVISSSEYGNLSITFSGSLTNYIVQLLQGEKKIYESTSNNNLADFSFLKPGKYVIKIIEDLNNNGRWDTGNYLKRIQPEPVKFYHEEIEIRANWNHEIEWDTLESEK